METYPPQVHETPLRVRIFGLIVRPILIVIGSTAAAHALLTVGVPSREGPGALKEGYFTWLGGAITLDLSPELWGRFGSTLLLVVVGLVLGLALAVPFGLALRSKRWGGAVAVGGLLAGSLPPVVVAITLVYWFGLRLSIFPLFGDPALSENPAEALRAVVLPATVVALAVAPGLAAAIAGLRGQDAPLGSATMMAATADRADNRVGWRIGFPFGALLLATLAAEVMFGRDGVVGMAVTWISAIDHRSLLDTIFVIALAAAGSAFVVDLLGFRSSGSHLSGPGSSGPGSSGPGSTRRSPHSRPSTVWPAMVSTLAAAVLVIMFIAGLAYDDLGASPDAGQLLPPLEEGHLLGTDFLSRDVLAVVMSDLPELLIGVTLAGLIAVVAGAVLLRGLWHVLGPTGSVLGVLVDVVAWPVLGAVMALWTRAPSWSATVIVLGVVLTPVAFRLAAREVEWSARGGPWQLAGLVPLMAGAAFSIILVTDYLGLSTRESSIAFLLKPILVVPERVAVIAMIIIMINAALNTLGSGLIRLGWARSASAPISPPDQPLGASTSADPSPVLAPPMAEPVLVRGEQGPMVPVPSPSRETADPSVWAPPADRPRVPNPPQQPDPLVLERTRAGAPPLEVVTRPLGAQDPTGAEGEPPGPVAPDKSDRPDRSER